MSKKITKEEFASCFYYIAPGLDFEPLMRFSHICDTFIYANLYYTFEEVLEGITAYFSGNPYLKLGQINRYDICDQIDFELHKNHQNHLIDAFQTLDSDAKKAYNDVFVPALAEPEWMLDAEITRIQTGKKIRLKYFTGEGLASYIALSHNGAYPPKVLATIQTGVLEQPNGLMSKIFQHTKSSPDIWVKGFEPEHYYDNWDKNNSLAYKDKIFDVVGSDFAFSWEVPITYNSNGFNTPQKSIRHCKAFIKKTEEQRINSLSYNNYGKNKLIQSCIAEYLIKLNKDERLAVITSSLNSKALNFQHQNISIFIWEDEIGLEQHKKSTMEDSFIVLDKLSKSNQYDRLVFTPFGLEDEGALLDKFLKTAHQTKMDAIVYRPLDFINLKN